ncbi:MAG: HK97-gp10 family putative phage morphogenesis protein [Pseudomonadota bacterium]
MFDGLTILGIPEAIANLHRAVAPVNDQRIGENAATALEPIAEEARRLVPRDSGDLRDTIGVANELADFGSNGKGVYVGVLRAGADRHVFYAHFIEFGTVTQRASPFLVPAVTKHQDLVLEVLGVSIGQNMIGAL